MKPNLTDGTEWPRPVAEFLFENDLHPGMDTSMHGNYLEVVGTARTHIDPIRGSVLFCDNPDHRAGAANHSYLACVPDKAYVPGKVYASFAFLIPNTDDLRCAAQ